MAPPEHRFAGECRCSLREQASSRRARSDEAPARCWVCRSTDTRPFKEPSIDRALVPDDLKITSADYGQTLALRRCRDCGLVFAEEEGLRELVGLYERLEDPEYENTQDCRALQMRWLLARARRIHPHGRTLLDVGAGTGLLVAEARRRGYRAVGVEPSRTLVEAAARVNHVDLVQGVFPHPELHGRRFDLIFLVDVIEHVSQPAELVEACAESLTPSGVLLLVTPDIGSLTARLLGKRWWHLRLAHVSYFDKRSIGRMLERAGLEPVFRCRPTWFFRTEYIAQRLAQYLPIGWLNGLAGRVGLLRRLYGTVIRLNPRDSLLVAARPRRP